MDFGQLLTAIVTPFNENDEVDLARTTNLVQFLIEHGTDGFVVAGTTGESATLTVEEKLAMFEYVVKAANGRAKVIAGTGSNNTKATIELTQEAERLGIDGAMLVTPYYNRPNQSGLYAHFKAVAEATTLPIMIYNIPSRSVVNIEAETMIKLSQIDNIVSVKEASGNLDQMTTIIENTSSDFTLYSGDDSLTLPVLSIGGQGVVSVAAHVIGNEMKEMIAAYKRGDVTKAAALHRAILPIVKLLFKQPSPTPVKTALHFAGVDTGTVRMPLLPLTEDEKALLNESLQAFKIKMSS